MYVLFAMVNVCQIYVYFIPAVVVILFLAILFLNYSRPVVIASKQIDLKNKAPIFHSYNETMNGLTQIKAFNRRKNFV